MMVTARGWHLWAAWTLFASSQHLVWAWLLVRSPTAGWATAVEALYGGRSFNIRFLGVAAVAALLGVWRDRRGSSILGLVVALPQQWLLIESAFGAYRAITRSMYADGIIRPQEFIAADQLPVLLVVVFHSYALARFHWQDLIRRYGGRLWTHR